MPALPGTLTGPPHTDWTGYRVVASYGVEIDDVKVPGSVATTTPNDGNFTLALPDGYVGPVTVRASAPNGVEVASTSLAAAAPLPAHLDLPATPVPGIVVAPTSDPTAGRIIRLVGRVLDPTGAGSPAGLWCFSGVGWTVLQRSRWSPPRPPTVATLPTTGPPTCTFPHSAPSARATQSPYRCRPTDGSREQSCWSRRQRSNPRLPREPRTPSATATPRHPA